MIRKGEKEDGQQIVKLKLDNWKLTYKNIFPNEYLDKMTYSDEIEKFITNYDKRNIIVYEENNEILGYCYYGDAKEAREKNIGEIYAIYVHNDYQRRHIGEKLIKEALTNLLKHNNKVILWCAKDNYKAIKFYHKIGFENFMEKEVYIEQKPITEIGLVFDLKNNFKYKISRYTSCLQKNNTIAVYSNFDLMFLKNETVKWFNKIKDKKNMELIPYEFIQYLINKEVLELD